MQKTDTSSQLGELRKLFAGVQTAEKKDSGPLAAFLVPGADAHQSEYIADCDQRRAFISGFTGSAGNVIVAASSAALFTDGRYFLQAEQQLDSNWELVKSGTPGAPSEVQWLLKNLPAKATVAVDPFLTSVEQYRNLQSKLEEAGHKLVLTAENLVDAVWSNHGKPPRPSGRIFAHDVQFSGASVPSKLAGVRAALAKKGCAALVLCALDEIAWLFNLRGCDIDFNPVFFAYAFVTSSEAMLFVDEHRLEENARQLLAGAVHTKPYASFIPELQKRANAWSAIADHVWVGPSCNQAVAAALAPLKLVEENTPVCVAKAVKNEVELQGFRTCHVRDAAALCQYFHFLETQAAKTDGPELDITEVTGADFLEACRKKQEHFVSLSFATISGVGPHGAIIHYHPQRDLCSRIRKDALYLCDSGAQYRDGTTDVTRTIHLGQPTPHERRTFTLVLKGHIDLAMAVFPEGTTGQYLDVLARMPLYSVGLDYRHGTGHGVGSFLNVHEGPHGISKRASAAAAALQQGMVVTNEPGYYEDGNFGIRIENVMEVVPASTEFSFGGVSYLTFNSLTVVPIQAKLIDLSLLHASEIAWLNAYHQSVRASVGPLLLEQGLGDVYDWLQRNTEPL